MFAELILNRLKQLVKRKNVMIAFGILSIIVAGLTVLYLQVDARAKIDSARRADVIIVLGSRVMPDSRPSPSLSARAQHAIKLYQAGYAPYVIFSGGVGDNLPSEAETMRRIAESAGVPAAAWILEDQSHSTEENLKNSKALMDARHLTSAIIVSDSFHLYRAEIIARDLGIDAVGSGASDSPAYTRMTNRVWYTWRESIALVWYYATRIVGEPTWLYGILKGKI